jgi:hypothetical protein
VDFVVCLLVAVVASPGVLKDGGRHVESGGLACFSRDEASVHIPAHKRYLLGLRKRRVIVKIAWGTLIASSRDCKPRV